MFFLTYILQYIFSLSKKHAHMSHFMIFRLWFSLGGKLAAVELNV